MSILDFRSLGVSSQLVEINPTVEGPRGKIHNNGEDVVLSLLLFFKKRTLIYAYAYTIGKNMDVVLH